MPVSTRSQIFGIEDDNAGTSTATATTTTTNMAQALRNPHHGLKEKLQSLTRLYEQQKLASLGSRIQNVRPQESKIPPISALDRNVSMKIDDFDRNNGVMKENSMPNATVTKTYVNVIPQSPNQQLDDAKENMAANGDRIVGFMCPRKAPVSSKAARKLSLGSQLEARGFRERCLGQEMEPLFERQSNGGSSSSSRIMVFVRLRPMMKKEKETGSRNCVRIVNRKDVYLTEFASENDYLRLKRLRGRHFTFDSSFPESSTQLEVYSATTADLVEAVLQGRNGSVFCYGATGAGKTYTMLGTVENPGVMVLAIKDLFTKIRQRSVDGNHTVHLSYLEVYNETVRDLLSPGRPLVLREDKQGILAAGLSQYRAYSTDEVMALLFQGNKNRTTEPTRANETSSRSHAILQVMVEYRARDASMNMVNRVGKLSLIDLAGSERALATEQRTVRSMEGANINRSLLALSSCINALVEGKKHIPYRNSKLTQLLKDSLGGACNTVMIANISPSNFTFGETQNTLHWADRAKEIRNKAYETNEEIVQAPESEAEQAKLLLEVQKENRELRVQLAKQQQKLLTLQAQSLAANTSPTPSVCSMLTPPPSSNKVNDKRRPKISLPATPEQNRKKGPEETVSELQLLVKALEGEIERMKREHSSQLKKRDDRIRELTEKLPKGTKTGEEGLKMFGSRVSVKPKVANNGDIKTPSHRFQSPAPTAKKRSFWDITTANSPSNTTVNGRKTRSHVNNGELTAPPSMLLQPGFARQRRSPFR
ncbi:kinesin-like protein KIN-8A [Silene latifolia]|uniref:kinesin-like protein KIN-8A n=1 Tax=Silene latifolia TaxID=37657 RepID=UPI003D773225